MRHYLRILIGVLCITASFTSQAHADVTVSGVFGEGMVLQSGRPVPVWGWAEPDEQVTVSFRNQRVSAKTDAMGKWRAILEPLALGPPGILEIAGRNTVRFEDVLVGEVWICSGQSNMQFEVR